MVKLFCTLFIVSLGYLSFGQNNDTTCILTRWIEIEPSEANAAIFSSDENNIVELLKELSLYSKLELYTEEGNGIYPESDWIRIKSEKDTTGANINSPPYKENLFASVYTSWPMLTDENGDPIFRTLPDSTVEIAYGDAVEHPLSMDLINSIRIREHLIFNEESMSKEFTTTGFAIVVDMGDYSEDKVLFWVSMFELNEFMKNEKHPSWMTALNENNYSGFQYMQKKCPKED
jgi:hypothetical protein